MAKRAATSELNQDNWNEDDESEEPGTFTPLSTTELKNRVIKKAKRTLNRESDSSGTSPFAKFSGFSSSTAPNTNPFSFLRNHNSRDAASSFGVTASKDEKKENGDEVVKEKKVEESCELKKSTSYTTADKPKLTRNIEYYRQLRSLNESIINWMQLHLSKNPLCDFTPVFNDYKKHLDTLGVTYPVQVKNNLQEENKDAFKTPSVENSPSALTNSGSNDSFEGEKNKNPDKSNYGAHFSSNTTNTSTFSFGIKKTPTTTSTKSSGPTSSFEEESAPEKKTFQFSFACKKPFEDSTPSKNFSFFPTASENASADCEDVEYIPPKNDFVPVKEEEAFYSKRCKLFFKKGEGYAERGVGNLYLKNVDGKTQLLIRADTSLGNILLNIILSSSLPMSRTGKNNVLLVCVPNPPVDAKKDADSKEAIPFLIRVKTTEDADELLETLNKFKS